MTEYPDDLEAVPRTLQPGQRAEVWIAEVGDRAAQLVYSTDTLLLEAPNWAPDGRGLLLNGDGLLWRLDLGPEVELERVPIDDLPPINNDHVVDAERGLVYLSANDGHTTSRRSWAAARSASPMTRAAITSCTVSAQTG